MSRGAILLAACLLAATGVARRAGAIDLFVDQSAGDDANDGLSWATAKRTISAAADLTRADRTDEDLIRIAEGRYVEVVEPYTVGVSYEGGYRTGGAERDPYVYLTVIDGEHRLAHLLVTINGPARVDGIVFRNALMHALRVGGGSSTVVRDCVFEGTRAYAFSAYALVQVMRSDLSPPLVERCVFRDNMGERRPGDIRDFTPLHATGNVVIRDTVFDRNVDSELGEYDFYIELDSFPAIIENVRLNAGTVRAPVHHLRNVLARRWLHAFPATIPCTFTNVTVGRLELNCMVRQVPAEVKDSIILGRVDGQDVDPIIGYWCPPSVTVSDSIVRGGWPGTNVSDVDPELASGPLGAYYLGHVATGDPTTSPAVDAGSRDAADAGLELMTTRRDGVTDSGTVDLGYHYPPSASPATPIRRGVAADALSAHATALLPWTDMPGTASDPALELLFYDLPAYEDDIIVVRDVDVDSVRILARLP